MKRFIATIIMAVGFGVLLLVPTTPVAAQGANGSGGSGGCNTNSRMLTFPTWWRGLEIDSSTCSVKIGDQIEKDIAKIAANLVEIVLQVVGYASVIYIIIGGFHYLTAAGMQDKTVRARKTIQNAIIGLIISLISVGIVNLVAGGLGS